MSKMQSEIAAIAAENVLGNADFIRRLVKGEPSRAEKILGKIVQIKNALTGKGDANAQAAFVRKAEKLYLDAIAELGGTYRDGKIHLANREEDESVVENGENVVEDAANVSAEVGNVIDTEDSVSENKKSPERGEGKYSYDLLVKKPDMVIKDVALASTQEAVQYRDDTVKFGADMRKNAAQKNNPKNTETETYLFCKDLETDVLITKNSFKHGGARLDATYVTICKNVDVVLENSIVVNELSARDSTDGGYVLLGMVETPDDFVVVRSVVNKRSHRLMEFQQLDAIKKQEITKIEDVGLRPPDYPQKRGSATSSTISIAGLLDFVKNKNLANEVFSADVAQKLGVERAKGSLSNDLRFSRKAPTDGQAAKDHADRNYGKIYTKKDAREIISAALAEHLTFADEGVFGNLVGKSRDQAIEVLWKGLNSAEEGKRAGLALDMADFIIENAVAEDLYDDGDNTEQLERLKILRGYMHKLDLSAIKGEIEYKLGKKNTAALVWGARKNTRGIAVDVAAMELAERGIAEF